MGSDVLLYLFRMFGYLTKSVRACVNVSQRSPNALELFLKSAASSLEIATVSDGQFKLLNMLIFASLQLRLTPMEKFVDVVMRRMF